MLAALSHLEAVLKSVDHVHVSVTYLKNGLVQLHQGNRLPETRILAVPEMGVDSVYHVFQSISLSDEPPLRPKDVGVRAPDCLGAPDSVKTLTNLCASGDEIAVEVVTLGGHGLEAKAADWRPHAETFADDGLEVRQRLGLGPGDGGADGG